jgi:ABC-2 type transport system ATP-binding protein
VFYFGHDQRRVVESLDPLSWDVVGMNLEDAFVAYTRGPRRSLPVFGDVAPEPSEPEAESDRGAA